MNVKINSIHFDADLKLEGFIQERISKLAKHYDNILSAEVFLRLDKDKRNENKIAEIKIGVPGNEIFAKKQSKSFEESTVEVLDALKRQLQKDKEKYKKS